MSRRCKGVPCHPCSTPSSEKPTQEEQPSHNWASLSSAPLPPLLGHRRDPAHTATHPCLQLGFWETEDLGGSSELTNPDGLSLEKAEHRTDQTLWAVCMLGSKNKPLPISIKLPSPCFASREHTARLWQSMPVASMQASPGQWQAEQSSLPSSRPTCAAPRLGAPTSRSGEGQEVQCKNLSVRRRNVTEQWLKPIISLWDLLTASHQPAGNSLQPHQLSFSTAAPSHTRSAMQSLLMLLGYPDTSSTAGPL